MPPSPRLRYLFDRYVEEKWSLKNGLMTKAILRDKAFNFRKDDAGFTFEITRHPNAFRNSGLYHRVIQKWKVSLQNGVAECIGDRFWNTDDPD